MVVKRMIEVVVVVMVVMVVPQGPSKRSGSLWRSVKVGRLTPRVSWWPRRPKVVYHGNKAVEDRLHGLRSVVIVVHPCPRVAIEHEAIIAAHVLIDVGFVRIGVCVSERRKLW
jgi:hypothetical protein